jgi:hypothetical protein
MGDECPINLYLLLIFRLSQRLVIDVNSVLGLLHRVVVGDVIDGSEVHTVSIFDPEDGGSMYL